MAINYDKPNEIRDFRNGSWFWIQTHVWRDKRLGKADKVTYGTLTSYANTSQEMYPSIKRIAEDSDLSARQVYRCIKHLESLGYVTIERTHGKSNLYKLAKTHEAPDSKKRPHPTTDIVSPLTGSHLGGDKSTLGGGDKSTLRTISNITISKNNILSKDNSKPAVYGNTDINELVSYLKEKMELPRLDGSDKTNRQYANILLKRSKKGLDGVKWLINVASQDGWFKNHITSFRDLWNNQIKIISNTRQIVQKKGGFADASV
jgi:hypothetical protein